MIVLAALLLVAVAVVVVFLVVAAYSLPPLSLEWLGITVDLPPIWLFLLGAVTLFVAELALALLRGGSRRRLAKRRELKRLRTVEAQAAGAPTAAGAPHGQHRGASDGPATSGDGHGSEPAAEPSPKVTTSPPPAGGWHDDPR